MTGLIPPATIAALRHRWRTGPTLVIDQPGPRRWAFGPVVIGVDDEQRVMISALERPGVDR